MRIIATTALAVVIAGCSGAAPTPQIIYITPAPASEEPSFTAPSPRPSPTNSPSALPSEKPLPATPEPLAEMTVLDQWLIPWQSDFYAQANVIVQVENTGDTWISLEASESDYSILDSDGTVAVVGSFLYEYPRYLAPGGVGFFAEQVVTSDAKASEMKQLEVNTYFTEVDEEEAVMFTVSTIKNRPAQFTFEGPTTTGRLKNVSGVDVDSANVGAFYFDADGDALGFSYTNLVENVRAGQTKSFETVSGAPNFKLSRVANTVVIASTSDF